MWPTYDLIDRNGMVRDYGEGELNWEEQTGRSLKRGKIEQLISE